MPLSALPAKPVNGVLGQAAHDFVDFLAEAGQTYWQILPIGPTGLGDSPYQCFSAFAGNPKLIDREGTGPLSCFLEETKTADLSPRYEKFCAEQSFWLDDFALFMAVREKNGDLPLLEWPEEDINPKPARLKKLRAELEENIEAHKRDQFLFFSQWRALKAYANVKHISIIGDLPFYIASDSSEFWMRRNLFEVSENGIPSEVAGVPPDLFSADGQVWNNPVYRGDSVKAIHAWWIERLTQAAQLYDTVRIDHFRAFAEYYTIPVGKNGKAKAAKTGSWKPGLGMGLVNEIHEKLPGIGIIAEDLGLIGEDVKALVKQSGFPGMKVLQFAFETDSSNEYLPHNWIENSIVYTGTHDNNTLKGWLGDATDEELAFAMEYFNVGSKSKLPDAMIRAALAGRSAACIIPMADWLGLGAAARLNTPGTVGGTNWQWKVKPEQLSKALAEKIYHYTRTLYNRTE
jgi:4-alpha-glucanotransferase